jgi:t-SNARE complex subunit (syntaxin)
LSEREEIVALLEEIRDNQRLSLQRQQEHLEVAKEQIERSRSQVQQSIELQKAAIERVKRVSRVAIPGIGFCVMLIVYLLVRYF